MKSGIIASPAGCGNRGNLGSAAIPDKTSESCCMLDRNRIAALRVWHLFSSLDIARRSLAIGLLGLFSALSIVPFISSDPQSNLPACCRGNGKHRCGMQMAEQSTQNSGFTAVTPRCPLFPKFASSAFRIQLYPFAARTLGESMVHQPSAPVQAEAEHRVSATRAHHKRGPPPLTSRG
jgi:hypothetical protein